MRWLHLSDIHFNPIKDEADTLYLRMQLIEFLKEKTHLRIKSFLREIIEMQVVKKGQMRLQRTLQIIYLK